MKKFLYIFVPIIAVVVIAIPLIFVLINAHEEKPLDPGYYENGALIKSWSEIVEEYPDAFDGSEIVGYYHDYHNRRPSLFQNLTGMLVIDNSITAIGEGAFYDCGDLEGVVIPDSVTYIGNHAFECCSFLSITVPDSVTEIGNSAFSTCVKLESAVLGKNVKIIGEDAFENCKKLSDFNIPSNVTKIGACAFDSCGSLKSVVIPSGVTKIEFATFRSCSSLSSVSIPNSVTEIADQAFICCEKLKEIVIPNGVTIIGSDDDGTFESCDSLRKIVLPESVISIGDRAFLIGDSQNVITETIEITIDSAYIASLNENRGWLFYHEGSSNRVLYIKQGLEISTYISNNFTKQMVSDKAGYDKYIKK